MNLWKWFSSFFSHKGGKPPMNGQQEKMLLTGINAYYGCPLAGCVDDVNDVKAYMINNFGWSPENIHMLTDRNATTQNILSELNWLVDVQTGARLYFHYSGHGAQVPVSTSIEADGLLEVICPCDYDWSPGKMITDKQFLSIFSKVPVGCHFNWSSDSCHSGDLDKVMPPPHVKPRRMLPPSGIGHRIADLKAQNKHVNVRALNNGLLDVGFISGCKSNQTSADTVCDGHPCGAFTYFLLKTLQQNKTATVQQIAIATANALIQNGYSQTPQAEGARINLPLFG